MTLVTIYGLWSILMVNIFFSIHTLIVWDCAAMQKVRHNQTYHLYTLHGLVVWQK